MSVKLSLKKAEKILLGLLIFISFVALVGMILLIRQAESAQLAMFELLAFTISVIAVFLAVTGAITSIHQTQVMRRIGHDMKQAIDGLKALDADNELIKRKLHKDYILAKDIAEALADAGIMANDIEKRKSLAGNIEGKIRRAVQG